MESLNLGVAREIITPQISCQLYGYSPDVFSTSVEDDLTITAFYFSQGETKALMLSATVCLIQTKYAKEILSEIEQKFGIPKENCLLSATHTHSGPNTAGQVGWGDIDKKYCDGIFLPSILSAVKSAMSNARPVKMGVAQGDSLVGINRRELNENNELKLGQTPWGPFNPKMSVISFVSDGENVANIIHYGAHGTAAGKNTEISRDWSGVMVDALENKTGGITAFFNGPEGDVGPRLSNGKTVGDITYVRELGAVAAMDALSIYNNTSEYCDVKLISSYKTVHIPLKKRMDIETAKRMLEPYKNETVNRKGMMRSHFEQVIRSYETEYTDKDTFEIGQTVIALGDIVFTSFPYELFSEIGMRIDRAFKNKSVLSLSNTNGSEGYFITKDAVCRGGYEVDMFLYTHLQQYHDDADFYLMRETVDHIKSISEE